MRCEICGEKTIELGVKAGQFRKEEFHVRRCPACQFSCVANPWTEYHEVYSEAYYRGEGADPLVNYALDLECPNTTAHFYEWRGLLRAVRSLARVDGQSMWLDFGCGAGGLVRYLREENVQAFGFEEGAIANRAREAGIPILNSDDLPDQRGKFDVVTAIEVIEHVQHPLEVLTEIRKLLKPGGLFFCTTGNARRYRNQLLEWPYVIPEIHISFFEPETLALALRKTGFRPEWTGYLPGFTDILRFKILKSLRVKSRSAVEAIVPWPVVSRAAELHFKVFAHPIGWAC
jgi:SAM-dependent methyltransferase